MLVITGNTLVGELLDRNPGFGEILLGLGMHCLGCPASRAETLAEACEVHGANLGELLEKLNKQVLN